MVNVEGFFSAIKSALGIPLGMSWRKGYGLDPDSTTVSSSDISENPYAQAICDITADDVCRGEEPVSYNYELPTDVEDLPDDVFEVLESFKEELNSIVKWVSKDLQYRGVSVFNATFDKETNKVYLLPNLKELKFYLTKDKKIVAYDYKDVTKENVEDVIIFINYEKDSLVEIDRFNKNIDESLAFEVRPSPMQFKNAQSTLDALNLLENAMKRYRAQLSRLFRYATVDVGLSSGDVQKDVVEAISAALNADSMNLTSTTNEEYNDNIPIIPTRNGKGEPTVHIETPQGEIKEMADVKYYLDKLNLLTRFPATYMDFSEALDGTAASLIRSDLRYAKLCNSIRTLIERTINTFIAQTKSLSNYKVVFSLIQLPTSEDDDVLQAMGNYTTLATDLEEFVMGSDPEEAISIKVHRLKMIQDLFNASVKSPVLQEWFNNYLDYLEELREAREKNESLDEMEAEGGDEGDFGDFGGEDEGGFGDLGGGGDMDLDIGGGDEGGLDIGGGEDEGGGGGEIETITPQTE